MTLQSIGRGSFWLGALVALAASSSATQALGAVYNYTDWEEANVAEGTAQGTITLPDDSTVTVTFVATNDDGSPGTLYGAQVTGGTNYWSPDTPYLSEEVENAPPTPDLLQLAGGLNQTYEVTLSEPIKDPVMAIVSLGAPGTRITYDFDSPFTIVSQGAGYWGGSDTALAALPDDVLEGEEGHGTIRFVGTFSKFSWTVPTPESWHGFTFAIRTTEAIEPTPSEGGAGGVGGAAGGNAGGAGGAITEEGGAGAVGLGGAGAGGLAEAGAGVAGAPRGGSGGSGASASAGKGGTAGASSGGKSTMGSAGEDDAGDDDDDDDDGAEASCSCSVPGAASGSFASGLALFALAASTLLRRRRRTR